MYVQVKDYHGITLMPMETRLMGERKIFVEGEINDESASVFVKQVMLLNIEDQDTPIDVFINSVGGEINAGLLMYDAILGSDAPIRTFCLGKGYSMGAVLFASGTGGRYMLPHSELLLHEPLLGNCIGGSSSSIKTISDSLLKAREEINWILARHTDRTVEELDVATSYDHYFDPVESLAFGLCDDIVLLNEIMEV